MGTPADVVSLDSYNIGQMLINQMSQSMQDTMMQLTLCQCTYACMHDTRTHARMHPPTYTHIHTQLLH